MFSPAARLSRSALSRCLMPTLCAALLLPTAATAPAHAQDAQLTVSAAAYGAVRSTTIALNKSMIVDLPAGVAEVIVSQPTVAAAIMRTRTRAVVQGIGGGDTNIFFLDDQGRTISILDIKVSKNPPRSAMRCKARWPALFPAPISAWSPSPLARRAKRSTASS